MTERSIPERLRVIANYLDRMPGRHEKQASELRVVADTVESIKPLWQVLLQVVGAAYDWRDDGKDEPLHKAMGELEKLVDTLPPPGSFV